MALPSGMAEATALTKLNTFGCETLQCLPENMGQMKVLQDLDVSHCTSLQALPASIGGNAPSRMAVSNIGVSLYTLSGM